MSVVRAEILKIALTNISVFLMDTGIYKELPKNVAYDVPDFLGSVMELTDIVFSIGIPLFT